MVDQLVPSQSSLIARKRCSQRKRELTSGLTVSYRRRLLRLASIRQTWSCPMNFGQAIASGFKKYVDFTGRAARSEFWYWTLFAFLASIVAAFIDGAAGLGDVSPVQSIVGLVLLLPGLAVSARRLHDLDRTAWWLLLLLTGIGIILLIIWDCMRGTQGPNRFGPDPLAGAP